MVDGMPITINATAARRADKFLVTGSETPGYSRLGVGPAHRLHRLLALLLHPVLARPYRNMNPAARTDIQDREHIVLWWTPSTIKVRVDVVLGGVFSSVIRRSLAGAPGKRCTGSGPRY